MTELPEGAVAIAHQMLAFRYDSRNKLESAINVYAQRGRGWHDPIKQGLACDYDESLILSALIAAGVKLPILSQLFSRSLMGLVKCNCISPLFFPIAEFMEVADVYPWIYRMLATGICDRETLISVIRQVKQYPDGQMDGIDLNLFLRSREVTTVEIFKKLVEYGK